MNEVHFDPRNKNKSTRDKTLVNSYYNKRSVSASGLKTIFFSENPNELCDRLRRNMVETIQT